MWRREGRGEEGDGEGRGEERGGKEGEEGVVRTGRQGRWGGEPA